MAAKIGLWIDHRQAVIVILTDAGVKSKVINSKVEKHLRAADPTLKGPFKARQVPADDKHEREFNEHIKNYYSKIIEDICGAESVLIFGPGEAKKELKKQLDRNKLGGIVAAVESADNMTDNQIIAKVCKYFNVNVPADINIVESQHQRMKASASTHPRQS